MVKKRQRGRKRYKLTYPQHQLKPKDLLDFVELPRFTADWDDLELDDDDFAALQIGIIANPRGGVLVEGTGGLRKLRFAPLRWKTGKRGAMRICYAYFEEHSVALLCRAYAKSTKDDLTRDEKSIIRQLLERFGRALASGPIRFKGG